MIKSSEPGVVNTAIQQLRQELRTTERRARFELLRPDSRKLGELRMELARQQRIHLRLLEVRLRFEQPQSVAVVRPRKSA